MIAAVAVVTGGCLPRIRQHVSVIVKNKTESLDNGVYFNYSDPLSNQVVWGRGALSRRVGQYRVA